MKKVICVCVHSARTCLKLMLSAGFGSGWSISRHERFKTKFDVSYANFRTETTKLYVLEKNWERATDFTHVST